MVKTVDKPRHIGVHTKTNGSHPAGLSEPTGEQVQAVESEEEAVRLVRTLVESSRVREAREKIAEFLLIWPDSKLLNIGAQTLAPGIAKVGPSTGPKRSREKENRWLQENARNYPGEWLLVFEDRLIASGPDLNEVIRTGQESADGREGVLWFQPTPEWIYGRSM